MAYDIDYYPPDAFIVCDMEYGYTYFRLDFRDVAERLTSDDKWEIVSRMKKVLEDYLKEKEDENTA